MELKDVLLYITTVGAGLAAFWLIENVAWFATLSPRGRRIAAYALAAAIGIVAWLAEIAMLYTPTPIGWRAWVEGAVAVAMIASGLGQLIHGAKYLSNAPKT